MYLVRRDLGDLSAVLVNDAIDEHGVRTSLVPTAVNALSALPAKDSRPLFSCTPTSSDVLAPLQFCSPLKSAPVAAAGCQNCLKRSPQSARGLESPPKYIDERSRASLSSRHVAASGSEYTDPIRSRTRIRSRSHGELKVTGVSKGIGWLPCREGSVDGVPKGIRTPVTAV